jgi:hypothetical protein
LSLIQGFYFLKLFGDCVFYDINIAFSEKLPTFNIEIIPFIMKGWKLLLHFFVMILMIMKNLIKTGLIVSAVIAFASCGKYEFEEVKPACSETAQQPAQNEQERSFDLGSTEDSGNLLADRDKCKKCHTTSGKTMGIDWTAPYMTDSRYSSIEELINNYDFVNDVHLPKDAQKSGQTAISDEQKNELITYLKDLEINSNK